MDSPISADDFLPLILKLSHDERVRLARLALRAAGAGGVSDALAYRAAAPRPAEFSSDDEGLAWESEGWDEFDASR